LVLCTLLPSKGVEVAVEAARLLTDGRATAAGAGRSAGAQEREVDLSLRLVGPAPPHYRRRLERRVADLGLQQVVEIREATPAPQEEFAWTNVLLVCSDNEAFGRVTVEALMSGRPVIGTRSGGTTELVSPGVNGLLFPPGDALALASALRDLAYDPALLERMSEQALASTRGRFTPEEQVERMVAVLSRAAADGRREREGRQP
jgi:glycosyltransferase involved in cell wall biosynthesis